MPRSGQYLGLMTPNIVSGYNTSPCRKPVITSWYMCGLICTSSLGEFKLSTGEGVKAGVWVKFFRPEILFWKVVLKEWIIRKEDWTEFIVEFFSIVYIWRVQKCWVNVCERTLWKIKDKSWVIVSRRCWTNVKVWPWLNMLKHCNHG